jgi:hypothetical protein
MYPTVRRLKMVSTTGGMRRILKNKGTVANYIRQAVESGSYRSEEELQAVYKERRDSADDLKTIMRRFRQDIVRGTAVHDYPVEYRILQQHPPIPDPPKTPVKWLRKMKAAPNPVRKLASNYLSRMEQTQKNKQSQSSGSGSGNGNGGNNYGGSGSGSGHLSADDYHRLLGVPRPSPTQAMGQKTAATTKAYAVAVKQYQLQRTEGLSERQALAEVEQLLTAQNDKERTVSRERAESIKTWKESASSKATTSTNKSQSKAVEMSTASKQESSKQESSKQTTTTSKSSSVANSLPFVVNARTAQGMMGWSERLQTVPYTEWTIGASTALDHWIAKNILDLSEETWQMLLEGEEPALLGRGRDIVAVREALFPETAFDTAGQTVDGDAAEADEEDAMTMMKDEAKATEKSIEELLASLGGLNKPQVGGANNEDSWNWLDDDVGNDVDMDAKVDKLTEELQGWRQMNVTAVYDKWSDSDKQKFKSWMAKYVETLVPNAERGRVDFDTTRHALLSEPPVTRDQSAAFWSQLQDEGQAAALLEVMRKDGAPVGASILQSAFWGLRYDEQLERLMNLGALRPLLDEYTTESDRTKFLQRHGDTLLAGVELEHLVQDPKGPIRYDDLDGSTADELGVAKDARFRLEVQPYQSSGDTSSQEKTRLLFMAWNQHKAGRARYEEKLFQTGRLGLRYTDRVATDDDDGTGEVKK